MDYEFLVNVEEFGGTHYKCYNTKTIIISSMYLSTVATLLSILCILMIKYRVL